MSCCTCMVHHLTHRIERSKVRHISYSVKLETGDGLEYKPSKWHHSGLK